MISIETSKIESFGQFLSTSYLTQRNSFIPAVISIQFTSRDKIFSMVKQEGYAFYVPDIYLRYSPLFVLFMNANIKLFFPTSAYVFLHQEQISKLGFCILQ